MNRLIFNLGMVVVFAMSFEPVGGGYNQGQNIPSKKDSITKIVSESSKKDHWIKNGDDLTHRIYKRLDSLSKDTFKTGPANKY